MKQCKSLHATICHHTAYIGLSHAACLDMPRARWNGKCWRRVSAWQGQLNSDVANRESD